MAPAGRGISSFSGFDGGTGSSESKPDVTNFESLMELMVSLKSTSAVSIFFRQSENRTKLRTTPQAPTKMNLPPKDKVSSGTK